MMTGGSISGFNRKFSMKYTRLLFLLLLTVLFAERPVAAEDLEKTSDVLMVAIPLAGLGSTIFYEDGREGSLQFLKALASSEVLVQGLKHIVDKDRPNGKSGSFPSGHASRAFMGAAFIHKRYGFQYAVPAYIGAAFAGYGRIVSDNHYLEDVLAGAAIGVLSSFYFTKPYDKVTIIPVAEAGFYGIKIFKEW